MRTRGERLARWRTPLSIFVIGTAAAGAVAATSGWADAATVEIFAVLTAAGFFALAGSDSDAGAVFGHRMDERQGEVALRAQALAFRVMYLVSVVCVVVVLSQRGSYWQADVVGSSGGITFIVGLRLYGLRSGAPAREDGEDRGVGEVF